MCIGVPMQIVNTVSDTFATCQNNGVSKTIDMQLVGAQTTGTWVLVFIDAAREVISARRAKEIQNALNAVDLIMSNDGVDTNDQVQTLFADLIDREPINPFATKE